MLDVHMCSCMCNVCNYMHMQKGVSQLQIAVPTNPAVSWRCCCQESARQAKAAKPVINNSCHKRRATGCVCVCVCVVRAALHCQQHCTVTYVTLYNLDSSSRATVCLLLEDAAHSCQESPHSVWPTVDDAVGASSKPPQACESHPAYLMLGGIPGRYIISLAHKCKLRE